MGREEKFRTVSFGGYDKAIVDGYVTELKKAHQRDVDDLKQTISKLSETVKSLQLVKDSISTESNQAIENMQKYNESLQVELEKANRKLEDSQESAKEYTSKLELISKTLVETNERCEKLLRNAEEKSKMILEEADAQSKKMLISAKEESDRLLLNAKSQSNYMVNEAEKKSDRLIEDSEKQSENILRRAEDEREGLRIRAEEEYKKSLAQATEESRRIREDAITEKEILLTETREKVANIRGSMRRECESVSSYMTSLMQSVEGVVNACNETKLITDRAFRGIEPPKVPENNHVEDDDIPSIEIF